MPRRRYQDRILPTQHVEQLHGIQVERILEISDGAGDGAHVVGQVTARVDPLLDRWEILAYQPPGAREDALATRRLHRERRQPVVEQPRWERKVVVPDPGLRDELLRRDDPPDPEPWHGECRCQPRRDDHASETAPEGGGSSIGIT